MKWRSFSKDALAVLTVSLAMAVGGDLPKALAQTVTPQSVADTANAAPQCQTPEGSWLYTVSIPGFGTFQGIETYAAGGGYSEADQLSFNPLAVASAGHGAWKSTGPNTFLLTYLNLTFDAFSSGNPTGTLLVRQTTKLDKTGNNYSGSGDFTYYTKDGKPEPNISGKFTITAKRIVVQAPAK